MAVDVVKGVEIRPAPERARLAERVVALAPSLLSLGMATIARFPTDSRLRRRALQEGLSRAFAAVNRREDPWFLVGYEPDCEIYPAAEFRALGMSDCYHGPAGWREMIDDVRGPLPDVRWTPEHVIDLGDRWVARLGMRGTGRASGVQTNQTWGSVYHLSPRGRIARQEIYWTWVEALAAAGLQT